MRNLKKNFSAIFTICLVSSLLVACGGSGKSVIPERMTQTQNQSRYIYDNNDKGTGTEKPTGNLQNVPIYDVNSTQYGAPNGNNGNGSMPRAQVQVEQNRIFQSGQIQGYSDISSADDPMLEIIRMDLVNQNAAVGLPANNGNRNNSAKPTSGLWFNSDASSLGLPHEAGDSAPFQIPAVNNTRLIDDSETQELIEGLQKRLNFIENDMKGDVASLKSENLKLLQRIAKLEKYLGNKKSSGRKSSAISSKSKPQKKSTQLKNNKPKTNSVAANSQKKIVPGSYKDRYKTAHAKYVKREFRQSIQEFRKLLNLDSKHSLADNAQYWIGECYFHVKNFDQALIEFSKVLEFENSNKSDAAIVMMGISYKRLGNFVKAEELFHLILDEYPKSSFRKRATTEISKINNGYRG